MDDNDGGRDVDGEEETVDDEGDGWDVECETVDDDGGGRDVDNEDETVDDEADGWDV